MRTKAVNYAENNSRQHLEPDCQSKLRYSLFVATDGATRRSTVLQVPRRSSFYQVRRPFHPRIVSHLNYGANDGGDGH